jgi:hypothetical protein
LGQGCNGAGGLLNSPGSPGSGGSGVAYGGGGGGGYTQSLANNYNRTPGGGGAIRIIWPGCARTFPSTNTGNL